MNTSDSQAVKIGSATEVMKTYFLLWTNALLVSILAWPVVGEAAGAKIERIGKGSTYTVTGHGGSPLAGNAVVVNEAPKALLNVTVYSGKSQKSFTTSSVEVDGVRLIPSRGSGNTATDKISSVHFGNALAKGHSGNGRSLDFEALKKHMRIRGNQQNEIEIPFHLHVELDGELHGCADPIFKHKEECAENGFNIEQKRRAERAQ